MPIQFHNDLSSARLRELLNYNPLTGEFRWAPSTNKRFRGKPAGSINNHGYHRIQIDKREYVAHRLAWLFVHGEWPIEEIDHVNGDRKDNRLENLRQATRAENQRNSANWRRSSAGLRGVQRVNKKYHAHIQCDGKQSHIGSFASPEAAHAAYYAEASRLHGEFARTK